MLMQSAIPSGSPLEQALRRYPSVVPHLEQKSARSAVDKDFKYANNLSMRSLYQTVYDPSTTFYHSVFYEKANSLDDCWMGNADIRRERLKALIAERYNGIQANMVRDTGINAGELSALMRNKSFGEKKARALEKQLGLPDKWLDGVDGTDAGEQYAAIEAFRWILEHGAENEKSILLATVNAIQSAHKPQEPTPTRVVRASKGKTVYLGPDRRAKTEEGNG